MKGIIVDIDKLTESKELYNQKPKRVMVGFIYTIVLLFAGALLYSIFGKIEIVTKAAGIIRPNDQVSTVSGMVGGQIAEVMFMDGTTVQEGDILLVLDYTSLQTDLKNFEESRIITQSELDMTEKYITSIQQEKNLFSSDTSSEEYQWYVKYELYNATVKDKEISLAYEQEQEMTQRQWLKNEINRQNTNINGLSLLKQSIETGTNLVEEYPRYNYQYQIYTATVQGLEIEKTKDYDLLQQDVTSDTRQITIKFYQDQIDGYKKLLDSIDQGKNLFTDSNSVYSLMYEEYAYLQEDAKQAYESAKLQLDMLRESSANSEVLLAEDTSNSDLTLAEQEVISKENAITAEKNKTIQEIKSSLAEAELQKNELETEQAAVQDKNAALAQVEELYEQTIEQKRFSLLQQAEESAQTIRQERDANTAELDQVENNLSKLGAIETDDDEILPVTILRLQELQASLDSRQAAESNLLELDYQIRKTQLDIEATTIKASQSGVINTLTDVTNGDILQAGTTIATIIPQEEQEYKVQIYMDDTSITGIKAGDKVRYTVGALPSNQYGTLTGTVVNISKDTKQQGDSAQGYYLVEATLEKKELRDKDGNEGEIAIGMTVDAQVVIQEKRIISYVLEKINIL